MPKVYSYQGMPVTQAQLDRIITYAYRRMLEDKALLSHGQSRPRTVTLPDLP